MGRLDTVSKVVLQQAPGDFLKWLRPKLEVVSARPEPTELTELPRLVDKLVCCEIATRDEAPREILLHIEVMARWKSGTDRRLLSYFARLHDRYPSSLATLLIVLKPAKRRVRKSYCYTDPLGRKLKFRYSVRCLWRMTEAELLGMGLPGLIPFLPYTRAANPDTVYRGLEALEAARDEAARVELQSSLLVFAAEELPEVDWRTVAERRNLMKSTLIREFEARGEARGEARERIRLLSQQLELRLGDRALAFKQALPKLSTEALDLVSRLLIQERKDNALIASLNKIVDKVEMRLPNAGD